jgi:hypothetical protein
MWSSLFRFLIFDHSIRSMSCFWLSCEHVHIFSSLKKTNDVNSWIDYFHLYLILKIHSRETYVWTTIYRHLRQLEWSSWLIEWQLEYQIIQTNFIDFLWTQFESVELENSHWNYWQSQISLINLTHFCNDHIQFNFTLFRNSSLLITMIIEIE